MDESTEKERLIEKSYEIFSNFKQPVHYTIHGDWCFECKEFEETLDNVTRKMLTIKQIGRSSWSPIPNLNYQMPGILRFVALPSAISFL